MYGYYKKKSKAKKSRHAERCLIDNMLHGVYIDFKTKNKKQRRKFQKKLKNGTLIVFRFNHEKGKKRKLAMSAPCQDCFKYIQKHSSMISHIIYSNKQGFLEKHRLSDMQLNECYMSSGFTHLAKEKKHCRRC
tara:strand:+ start:364 stop:762 length:399 start_codon:yes stop_codon:yes gene_type:complete